MADSIVNSVLRGDLPRLSRTTSIVTSTPSAVSPFPDFPSHTNIKRSKPLKYAYEKEIVLYAHHKSLDYFSTECIYSPEAFRGSARALIKNLERVRPSAILDVVRSGEDMARLVPGGNEACSNGCGGQTALLEEEGGCGSSNGRSAGGEMASMEHQLAQNERAAEVGLEVEITSSALNEQQNGKEKNVKDPDVVPLVNGKKGQRPKGPAQTPRRTTRQTMGQCKRCGYLTSQEICKACILLKGLNKNRPKNEIEVSSHAPEKEHGHMNGTTSAMPKLQPGAD